MTQTSFSFDKTQNITPMMRQYLSIKNEYKDYILFYRMGDFYEMFFEDAIESAKILNIALTKRGKQAGEDIPMCGIPFHSSESYLHKLINNGKKVAICEQTESPEEAKKRGYKAVVRREVVRVITPGTIFESAMLDCKSSNYLVSIAMQGDNISIAYIDISTSELRVLDSSIISLSSDLSRLNPQEILIADNVYLNSKISIHLTDYKKKLTTQVKNFFDYERCYNNIKKFYNINAIETIGDLSEIQISSLGAILEYLSITQKKNLPKLDFPKIIKNQNYMVIDHTTRRNLELTQNLEGNREFSLLGVIDRTITNMGSRLLFEYIAFPLLDKTAIESRLDMVEFFVNNSQFSKKIRYILKNISDIARATARILANYGGPRDLLTIKNTLIEGEKLIELFAEQKNFLPINLKKYCGYLFGFEQLIQILEKALKDEVPVLTREGNFIKQGYNQKLDEIINIKSTSQKKIDSLREKYIDETKISNLKIKFNNIIGFYIEVTPLNVNKINSDKFIHRQTLGSSIRYTTLELKELEELIINADAKRTELELNIFYELKNIINNFSEQIYLFSDSIAVIDLASSLAVLAIENNYVRPLIFNNKNFNIIDARHPVVEIILKKQSGQDFIANDCNLEANQEINLLSGPNMAGKSTFLRQNAIIAILAQIGSYVPAKKAEIGIIDRIFSRVGAADDLAKGRSTFMMEMIETAIILNQATEKSLIILDEIGRGTSTYDGVAIAWSTVEYIHNKISARTIFATHYHELAELEESFDKISCFKAEVKEWEDKIIFLHKIIKGAADKSYGIYVAKIAGVPNAVINRASDILQNFHKEDKKIEIKNIESLPERSQTEDKLKNYLKKIDLNNITPIDAINHLSSLFKLLN